LKLIVGLGNPGRAYAGSRHNIGFLVIDNLAKDYKVRLKRTFCCRWLSARARREGSNVLLAEPFTYMNLSGSAVATLLKKNKIGLANLLVICDDLNLELGRLRIKASGSSGGHRGLESIIDSLGSRQFSRLRIGIGKPDKHIDAAGYVLSPFDRDEKKIVAKAVEEACVCAKAWVREGVDKTMDLFNGAGK
jgi:PTH1 family peptidyl-tRNA hydrolase